MKTKQRRVIETKKLGSLSRVRASQGAHEQRQPHRKRILDCLQNDSCLESKLRFLLAQFYPIAITTHIYQVIKQTTFPIVFFFFPEKSVSFFPPESTS